MGQLSKVIGRMGPEAASATPQLLVALQDEDQFVRLGAVCALGSICADDDAVLGACARGAFYRAGTQMFVRG